MKGDRTACYVNEAIPVVTKNNADVGLVSDKDVYNIKPYYLLPFSCNGNQSFLAVKTCRCHYTERNCKETCYRSNKCVHAYYKNYILESIAANRLTKSDFLLIPRYKKVVDVDRVVVAEKDIYIDTDFLRIVSLYLTAGSIEADGLKFVFTAKGTKYVNFIKEYFIKIFPDIRIYIPKYKDIKTKIIIINDKLICDYFKIFGSNKSNKVMPEYFLELPFEKQKMLIQFLIAANGRINEIGEGFYTSSKTLAYQVKSILDRIGTIASIHKYKYKNNNPDYYRLDMFCKHHNFGIVKHDYIFTPIYKINKNIEN